MGVVPVLAEALDEGLILFGLHGPGDPPELAGLGRVDGRHQVEVALQKRSIAGFLVGPVCQGNEVPAGPLGAQVVRRTVDVVHMAVRIVIDTVTRDLVRIDEHPTRKDQPIDAAVPDPHHHRREILAVVQRQIPSGPDIRLLDRVSRDRFGQHCDHLFLVRLDDRHVPARKDDFVDEFARHFPALCGGPHLRLDESQDNPGRQDLRFASQRLELGLDHVVGQSCDLPSVCLRERRLSLRLRSSSGGGQRPLERSRQGQERGLVLDRPHAVHVRQGEGMVALDQGQRAECPPVVLERGPVADLIPGQVRTEIGSHFPRKVGELLVVGDQGSGRFGYRIAVPRQLVGELDHDPVSAVRLGQHGTKRGADRQEGTEDQEGELP